MPESPARPAAPGPEPTGAEDEIPNNIERLMAFTGGERVKEFLKMVLENEKEPDSQNWMTLLLPHLHFVSAASPPSSPTLRVTFRHTVQPEHCNGLGNMHGGCTATLFDFCTSVAIAASPDLRPGFWSRLGVTRTLSTTYLRPAPRGEAVLIECEVAHLGRRMCALRAVMTREVDGALLATCEHGKVNTDPPAAAKL